MTTNAELSRAVDAAVAATPGVARLYSVGARPPVPGRGGEMPFSRVSRRLDSYEAQVAIGAIGEPAGVVADRAAAAAAAVLPPGTSVMVRVARVEPVP